MAVVLTKPYVEFKNEGYWIIGTRISLDSVIYAFRQGLLPESIAQSYPLLDIEKVYGAIAMKANDRSCIIYKTYIEYFGQNPVHFKSWQTIRALRGVDRI